MTERHIIKITVEVKLTKLLVRFPCKLHFQLKTGNLAFMQKLLKLTPSIPIS